MAPSQKFRAQLARAKRGDTEAQAFVFSCHYFGNEGVTKNLALAFKFCRMAAEGGETKSQDQLGGLYTRGEGVERDERKATTWNMRAAEGGDSDAQFYTAQRYRSGTGHDAPNMKEAVKWFQAAVAQGHAGAELQLGDCYDEGDGVKMNPGLALKLWRKCAQRHETGDYADGEQSVAYAHHLIGECYFLGSNGLKKDMRMAMQWWTKAAEQGYVTAQRTVGEIYLMGFEERVSVGTFDRDVPIGMKYLMRARTMDERKYEYVDDVAARSRAEAVVRDFHAAKSCMGCGSPNARKLSQRVLVPRRPHQGPVLR
jgi:TPR repeat protein